MRLETFSVEALIVHRRLVSTVIQETTEDVFRLQAPPEAVILTEIKESLGHEVVEVSVRAHGEGVEEIVHDGPEVAFITD